MASEDSHKDSPRITPRPIKDDTPARTDAGFGLHSKEGKGNDIKNKMVYKPVVNCNLRFFSA